MAKTDFNGWPQETTIEMLTESVNYLETKVEALQHLVVGLAALIEEINPDHAGKVDDLLEIFDREEEA